MDWFWEGTSKGNKAKDPLRNLDPSLRDYLKKESPVKYDTSNPPATGQSQAHPSKPTQTERLLSKHPTTSPSSSEPSDTPKVPPQSLYQDGRYAHIWATYQSQSDVESSCKSEQEKIDDLLAGYKDRKAQIGRAAVENCALEQSDVTDCFMHGGLERRMRMCKEENTVLSRCFTMQGKFLKALGYLSTYDRPPEVDERIQMHADTLYHRMLAQEKAAEEAKASGLPVPEFAPLLPLPTKLPNKPAAEFGAAAEATQRAANDEYEVQPSDLSQKVQAEFKKRMDGLTAEQREIELRAIKGEIQAGVQVSRNLDNIYEKQAEELRARKEMGKETIRDKLASTFGFRAIGGQLRRSPREDTGEGKEN